MAAAKSALSLCFPLARLQDALFGFGSTATRVPEMGGGRWYGDPCSMSMTRLVFLCFYQVGGSVSEHPKGKSKGLSPSEKMVRLAIGGSCRVL